MRFERSRIDGEFCGPAPVVAGGVTDADVGRVLKRRRAAAELTQKHVADRMGVSFQQFQKYETGVNRLTVRRLIDFCAAVDAEPDAVLSEILDVAARRPSAPRTGDAPR